LNNFGAELAEAFGAFVEVVNQGAHRKVALEEELHDLFTG
jgi:hypothetical protein